jgi:hypothetical protein
MKGVHTEKHETFVNLITDVSCNHKFLSGNFWKAGQEKENEPEL